MQSYALPGSTARQLFNSSTLLDSSTHDSSTRQISTELDSAPRVLDTPAHAVSLDLPRRARQLLDSYSKGSTGKAFDSPSRTAASTDGLCRPASRPAARQPSTARSSDSQGSKCVRGRTGYPRRERCRGRWYMVIKSSSYFIPLRTPCGCSLPLRAYDSAHPRREPKDGHNPRLTTAERHRSFARAAVAYVSLSSQLLSGGR